MPSAHAHMPKGDAADVAEVLPLRNRPIRLPDIDRVLAASAEVEDAPESAPIRTWREELTVALESLRYARVVLSGDIAILRCGLRADSQEQSIVAEVSTVLTTPVSGDGGPTPGDTPPGGTIDPDVFLRSDELISAHQEMAQLDLSALHEVTRVLCLLEEELSAISERHGAVEIRLQQIRSAIVRQYQRGAVSTLNWPA